MKLTCVICDSEDFDLTLIKNPATKRPLGIVFCCKGCRPKLIEEIKGFASIAREGIDKVVAESKLMADERYDQIG